jgi:hypothetical protein
VILNYKLMKKICKTPTEHFNQYGLTKYTTTSGIYYYKDNGSDILAVGHLDSVCKPEHFSVLKLSHCELIFSPVLDDRLGVYIILDALKQLNINVDILLTEGEEKGKSTAAFFETDKQYNWMVEFDRAGSDVVTYQYENPEFKAKLESVGYKVGIGTFSDISALSHLGCSGVNIGIGYESYHSLNANADVDIIYANLAKFKRFYDKYNKIRFEYDPAYKAPRAYPRYYGGHLADDYADYDYYAPKKGETV